MSNEKRVSTQRQHPPLEEVMCALAAEATQTQREKVLVELQQLQQQQQTPSPQHQQQQQASDATGNQLASNYSPYWLSTPPDPRIPNPRLLENYVDWYHNWYVDEERHMPWIDIEAVYYAEMEEEEEEKADIQMCDAAAMAAAAAAAPTTPSTAALTPQKDDQ